MALKFNIPGDLLQMFKERRVIPFLGAGFSSGLDFPDWEELLRKVAADTEDELSFDDVKKCCNEDYLQIAEYYFLRHDKSIGPIRYSITKSLNHLQPTINSTAHIELVNLGAPQIYTTNYDELIEATFAELKHSFQVIALPKHVALSDPKKTQIVKYHGDLKHEHTLVLTESSYYKRMNFESPMDLKFRSDLLGKSVLFIGYSFRDINIRIIWYKLMEMMRDIKERPISYIVRLTQNPVLDTLYEDVGIKTILLDPNNEAKSSKEKILLLDRFMYELAIQVSDTGDIPGTDVHQYMSPFVVRRLQSMGKILKKSETFRYQRRRYILDDDLENAAKRRIPKNFVQDIEGILQDISTAPIGSIPDSFMILTLSYSEQIGVSPDAAIIIIKGLARRRNRLLILSSSIDWQMVWRIKFQKDNTDALLHVFNEELDYHEGSHGPFDEDLAYVAYLANMISNGILVSPDDSESVDLARELLERCAGLYPSCESFTISVDGPPNVFEMITEINDREGYDGFPEEDDVIETPF